MELFNILKKSTRKYRSRDPHAGAKELAYKELAKRAREHPEEMRKMIYEEAERISKAPHPKRDALAKKKAKEIMKIIDDPQMNFWKKQELLKSIASGILSDSVIMAQPSPQGHRGKQGNQNDFFRFM